MNDFGCDESVKRQVKVALGLSVDGCMTTYVVTYRDIISALAYITAEMCIEQSGARSHKEDCPARYGRFVCTCKDDKSTVTA